MGSPGDILEAAASWRMNSVPVSARHASTSSRLRALTLENSLSQRVSKRPTNESQLAEACSFSSIPEAMGWSRRKLFLLLSRPTILWTRRNDSSYTSSSTASAKSRTNPVMSA